MRKELVGLAKLAPLGGFINSGDFKMIDLKERYNKSDYYIVEVLDDLYESGEIRDLDVNYDIIDGHILSYKFR